VEKGGNRFGDVEHQGGMLKIPILVDELVDLAGFVRVVVAGEVDLAGVEEESGQKKRKAQDPKIFGGDAGRLAKG
jgi:hypothetical protein